VSRSLSNPIARLGHDFFEVTFLYKADNNTPNPNYIIARASWELGEPAGINGVYRSGSVNYYDGTKANPVDVATLDAGNGLAVLFVGRRTDRTLLAVGTLNEIDGVSVATNYNITPNTKKVSFAVNAFQASVNNTYDLSSFQIPANPSSNPPIPAQETQLKSIKVGGDMFPYFLLPMNVTASASYTVGFSSATHGYSFYQPAIIYAGGALCRNLKPHYTLPPSQDYDTVQEESRYGWNPNVRVSITSPTDIPPTAGSPFSGTVGFSIQTMGENKVIISLTFQIPVYAVTASSDSAGNTPVQWQIKPAYNQYYEELDNGDITKGNGGAVLIGIGDIEGGTTGLVKIGEPIKFNNLTATSRDFTLKGMEFYFNDGNGFENLTPPNSPVGNPSYPDKFWEWAPDLTFYYDTTPDTFDPLNPGVQLTSANKQLPAVGDLLIRVKYNRGGSPYWLAFYVEVTNVSSSTDIPYENRIFIAKPTDFTEVGNRISSPGNYLLVFSTNINIPEMTFNNMNNLSPGVTIYIVSTVSGIIVGREARTVFNGAGPITIYIGKWPFNEPAFAGGNIVTNENFTIRSRGAYDGAPTFNTSMFGHGTDTTGTLTVEVLAGVTIDYPRYIGPTVVP